LGSPGKASAPAEVVLNPQQIKFFADAHVAAEAASSKAETELLTHFGSLKFKAELILNGGWRLARTSAPEILSQLKESLHSMEFTSNFGVDPAWRNSHPGQPTMDFPTIAKYGYIPNMWELRAENSTQVTGIGEKQWQVMDAAETGLYHWPVTSKPLPIGPDAKQGRNERPQYLAGNMRRVDIGVARYGAYAAVVRNDVVNKRALILGTDSGGWENICNASVAPIKKWMPKIGQMAARCDGTFTGGSKDHPVLGTADHQLHSILANTNVMGKVGGDLARLVYQLLTPGASLRPWESLLYTEAGLLGPLRPEDMKLMVASFPGVFGTSSANAVRLYCLAHKIPLVWALNHGETWAKSSSETTQFLPFSPTFIPVGPDRLIDPITWEITNMTMSLPSAVEWTWVFGELVRRRADKTRPALEPDDFKEYWNRLSTLGGTLQPNRRGACGNEGLCFGTYITKEGATDCLCKTDDEAVPAPIADPADLIV